MVEISVVVPVYKAEHCLEELYVRLTNALTSITDSYEIILIEDAGPDLSWEKIMDLAARDEKVLGVQFSRNFGQHYGITAGLDVCDGQWVVVMDCDLQDKPEDIPRLYEKAKEGYDVVVGKRKRRSASFLRRIVVNIFYGLFRYLSGSNYDGSVGNFRIMSRDVVENVRKFREQLRFFGVMVDWLGYPTGAIEIEQDESVRGESSYTYRKLLSLAFGAIIAYSDKPLWLAVKLGFLVSLLSVFAGLHIVYKYFSLGVPVEGWSSLMVSVFFLGGIIIALMGVIGVYLGKTFDEVKRRPLYIVRQMTKPEKHG